MDGGVSPGSDPGGGWLLGVDDQAEFGFGRQCGMLRDDPDRAAEGPGTVDDDGSREQVPAVVPTLGLGQFNEFHILELVSIPCPAIGVFDADILWGESVQRDVGVDPQGSWPSTCLPQNRA